MNPLALVIFPFLPLDLDATNSNPHFIQAGPLLHQFQSTLADGRRTEALSPILAYERKESERLWAISPLASSQSDHAADSHEFDLLYPLLTYDRFGGEYRFQIIQLFSFAGGQQQNENQQRRFTLFPIYFQQRSPDAEENYTALLPLYGTLKHRLFRDRIFFVLWPLYVKSEKRDVTTHNFPFPFLHVRRGNSLRGWQFWPLVGSEGKGVTHQTNVIEELELVPGHRKLFVLWPIFFRNDLGLGTTNAQKVRIVFPLFNSLRSPLRNSTTYLWPVLTVTDDREKKYKEVDVLGPLIVFADGEGKTARRVWPLFSVARSPTLESRFFLWPVYKFNRINSAPLDRRRTRILFFLYSDVIERNTESGDHRRRRDFWPFYTWRRELNGDERLQVLSLLEPLLPNHKSIQRNYSPLWSIWRTERAAATGAQSHSLLWNLYRGEKGPAGKKCALLFGLFQYEKRNGANGGQRHGRIFFIPWRSGGKGAGAEAEPGAMGVGR